MPLAVHQEWQERRELEPVRSEVQGVDASQGSPEEGLDAAGVDDGIGVHGARVQAVDVDLELPKRPPAVKASLELLAALARGVEVEEDPVRGPREHGQARVHPAGSGDGEYGEGIREDDVAGQQSVHSSPPRSSSGVEAEAHVQVQDARVDAVHDVRNGQRHVLRQLEQGQVLRQVSLDVPHDAPGCGLWRRSPEHLHAANPEGAKAVELAAPN
mmetsp:Transcript_110601/g.352794  ORF Transcript_110601/g.352794 Transcript_110601/m.352794 type:complete len:214 (+) Transcript_110601:121-762(+)